jgi:hypothetical protein
MGWRMAPSRQACTHRVGHSRGGLGLRALAQADKLENSAPYSPKCVEGVFSEVAPFSMPSLQWTQHISGGESEDRR